MPSFIEIQKAIVPELEAIVQGRYELLRTIAHLSPVGRRALADVLKTGERIIRSELETLKSMGLIETSGEGVRLSVQGSELLQAVTPYVKELLGLPAMEAELAKALDLTRVLVVPGDSDKDPLVRRELGRSAARQIQGLVSDGDIIAITGGTTMGYVAEMSGSQGKKVTVVPGRGALGEKVEIQANTIAARLAQGMGGSYRLLHAPDNLSDQAMEELVREPRIAEVLGLIRRAAVLVHGIGDALEMAHRRETSPQQILELQALDAVAEAFGYYFNDRGQIVWQVNSIGLRLDDLAGIGAVVTVAGGSGKARAIRAGIVHHRQHLLVTDQGAAEVLLSWLS